MKKLVRDKIPSIINNSGRTALWHKASDSQIQELLRSKLQEEVGEYLESGSIEEIADILEVIDAICKANHIDGEHLRDVKDRKRAERGGFDGFVVLDGIIDK